MKYLGSVLSMVTAVLMAALAVTLIFGQNSDSAVEQVSQPPISPTGKPNTAERHHEGRKATELMGKRVEDLHGEKLGVINDLVINPRSGRLEFVVLATGGFAGVGSQLKAVPPAAISQATAKAGILALNITASRWKNAPHFDRDQLASLESSDARLINQYYRQPGAAAASLTPAGRDSNHLALATEMIGQTVMNRQHQALGAIADLLVDLKRPQSTWAILKPDGAVLQADQSAAKQLFAIPAGAFSASDSGGNLILNVTPSQFLQAQTLDSRSWMTTQPGIDSPQIYLFQSSQSPEAIPMSRAILNNSNHQHVKSSWIN